MTKYIKITRSDTDGSYVQLPEDIIGCVEGELIQDLDYLNAGDSITLTVVEMSQEEFDKLPEFMGW